ncbi:MAG: HAD-IA family hydrolase [Desulfococcaceae bacterium]|jgi:HAD superfamily hydrolase (TIGR01509 family)|nr:HAD-IA family hydrolase [Desulfococcaceae bacterium]
MKLSQIHAVLFDFDGTLTQPGALDFAEIKNKIGCPCEETVLEYIERIPEAEKKKRAEKILQDAETESAKKSQPNKGAEEILGHIRSLGLKTVIITRNSRCSVELALKNFPRTAPDDFDMIITRETEAAPKPRPDGILLAAEKMGVSPSSLLMVGDFLFDIQAGKNAGSPTVFLSNGNTAPPEECDHCIARLHELKNIIRLYLPLPAGKFPNDLLRAFLKDFSDEADFSDPAILIRPGIGEDTAAMDVKTEEVLILKSDPITFATDAISHYALLINANDIATSGACPRWFLATILFPCGIIPREAFCILEELRSVCEKWGIALCGGHTEITDAVTRTVIAGTLAGTVKKSHLIDKSNIRKGDRVLLSKGIAVEGTSIIAREFTDRLTEMGLTEDNIDMCKNFLSQLSILDEARIAAECKGTSAMHDVTEGGLATALEELSIAGGHRIKIYMENIPVFPQTRALCSLLNIDPLGLIASGSLLITCREEYCKELIFSVFRAGIRISVIGEVLEEGNGIEAFAMGEKTEWPRFDRDEIARLFE